MTVVVKLQPEQIARLVAEHLRKNGFITHSQNVEFKVGSHLEGYGMGEHSVYDFNGCAVECVLDIPGEDSDEN